MNSVPRSQSSGALPFWLEVLLGGAILGSGTTALYRLLALQGSTQQMLAPWWMSTPVDGFVPFVPAAVWIYVSWYLAIVLLVLTDRETVRLGFAAFALAFIACSIGHAVWPVTIGRPFVDPRAGMSARILDWFYTFDPPRNLFPSFHAAGAGLVTVLRPKGALIGAVVFGWAVALSASCVLIRQHFVVDVLVGFPIGIASAWCARFALAAFGAPLRWSALLVRYSPNSFTRRSRSVSTEINQNGTSRWSETDAGNC
jgi:membrane-associated phospholipid phosphatase